METTQMEITQAVMILACARHAQVLRQILDSMGVRDWTEMPASQARRLGYLQDVPGNHPDNCCTFCGFGEPLVIAQVLAQLELARSEGEICAECTAYTWEVKQALSTHVALDLVCLEVVDCRPAPSAEYDGTTYYFCSEENRDSFLEQPDIYVQRYRDRRVGRRDVAEFAA